MNNKIIIVDENDNEIGSEIRDDKIREGIYRVSALWLKSSNENVLLAKRALTKAHHPGKWGPAVAGTIEEGETYDSNIIKETEEELGLKDIKLEKACKKRISGKYNFFVQWYKLILDKDINDFNYSREEIDEIKWISKEDLIKEFNENPEDFLSSIGFCIEEFC